MYGYIYKIVNDINNKIYIGQTVRTIEKRWQEHLRKAKNHNYNQHLYCAMRKYGIEHFSIYIIETVKVEELNTRERFYIKFYDTVNNGYNMTLGGDSNPMSNFKSKQAHDDKCKTNTFRQNVSIGLKAYRAQNEFTIEHRKKLSEKATGRINVYNDELNSIKHIFPEELDFYRAQGYIPTRELTNNFNKPKKSKKIKKFNTLRGDTRSINCYCIDEFGILHNFHSYKDAGIWWFENYKPFGEKYVQPTLQRKIISSIEGNELFKIEYINNKRVKTKITNIKWYKGGDDSCEEY